ncbi:hypothetical protein [Nocardia brasiliensis]|uniref:hypothetical protein n=1 Tax=Nocardia brasiliensis TaxID=37326 RepID=UPI0018940C9D|nr:hypothetical protein [Nocardia brasiliensis]MBF6548862.1 hypothetical protein [Nocardia brasiliensis]
MSTVEQASEDDRRWFEANPWARYRLRVAPLEEMAADLDLSDCPPGYELAVAVEQIAPGSRMRTPLGYVPVLPDHPEYINDQLKELWQSYVQWRKEQGLPEYRADEIRQKIRELGYETPDMASITAAGFEVTGRSLPK